MPKNRIWWPQRGDGPARWTLESWLGSETTTTTRVIGELRLVYTSCPGGGTVTHSSRTVAPRSSWDGLFNQPLAQTADIVIPSLISEAVDNRRTGNLRQARRVQRVKNKYKSSYSTASGSMCINELWPLWEVERANGILLWVLAVFHVKTLWRSLYPIYSFLLSVKTRFEIKTSTFLPSSETPHSLLEL